MDNVEAAYAEGDVEFLNKLDIEHSYAGSRRPLVQRHYPTPQERLESIQESQWWRGGDRDPRIDYDEPIRGVS